MAVTQPPFALSLSKGAFPNDGLGRGMAGFDRLSPNGPEIVVSNS